MAEPRRWSRAEVIQAMLAWNEKHGAPPKAEEWTPGTAKYPSYSQVRTLFGRWTDGIIAAGLSPSKIGRQRFDRRTAEALRREGWTDVEIGACLGVTGAAIGMALGRRSDRHGQVQQLKTREEREVAIKKAIALKEADSAYLQRVRNHTGNCGNATRQREHVALQRQADV